MKSIIGYSDHSIGPTISTAALGLGAKLIEKHFVISKKEKVLILFVQWIV